MKIDDATGTGQQAKVDSLNRLHTNSISQTTEHFANTLGQAWSTVIQQTPTGGCDAFFYIKSQAPQLSASIACFVASDITSGASHAFILTNIKRTLFCISRFDYTTTNAI